MATKRKAAPKEPRPAHRARSAEWAQRELAALHDLYENGTQGHMTDAAYERRRAEIFRILNEE